jgi:DNA-binding CsgD family transcriptional regulator
MVELSRDDLALVLEVVSVLSRAHDRTSFMRSALVQSVRAVPCPMATLNEVDPDAGRFNFWVEPELFPVPPETVSAFAELAAGHPCLRYYQRTGDGSARAISDFWAEEEFHRSELCRRVYGPLGVEHQMSIVLPAPRPTVLGLALNRSEGGFSARDRLVLDTLRPYLAQAWRTATDRERVTSLLGAATTAIGQAGYGAVVLSEPPEELTPGVLTLLSRSFGGPAAGGPLPDAVRHWLAGLAPGQDRRLELRPPLVSDGPGPQVIVRYLPPEGNGPGALAVRELRKPDAIRFQALGLSAREAEVVGLVVSGHANEAVARQLHIAPGTVKKHLDNIFSKLSVRGRGQLAALVLDMS